MNTKILLACVIMAALTSGCSTITGSTTQSVSIRTKDQAGKEVSGAACDLVNKDGTWFITSPGSVVIHRSNDDLQIVCKKEGLENGTAAVVSDVKGSMVGNIVFGGGIGAIMDHANGSAYEYPTLLEVLMGAFTKIETPKKEQPKSNPMGLSSN